MAEHRTRVNRLDRLILAGRDPDRNITLLQHVRFQWMLVVTTVIVVAFIGFLWQVQRNYVHSQCVDRNRQAALSRGILKQLVDASTIDKDRNQAKVWQQWLTVSSVDAPKC